MSHGPDMPGPEGWWNDFFIGAHAKFQMALTEETRDSDAEAAAIVRLAKISAGSRVLDIPCGQGRHSIRLAKLGAVVTGVDSSSDMIERAKHDAHDHGVDVSWIHSDMRYIAPEATYDCAICLGGSFGYFGRTGDQDFLKSLHGALRPGGHLLLDAPSLELIRARHKPSDESVIGRVPVVQDRQLDPSSGIARLSATIKSGDGEVSRTYYQQLYLRDELRSMLTHSGFEVVEMLDASSVPEFRSNGGHVLVLAHRLAD